MKLSLSRDPALWLTVVATAVRLIAAFWIDLSATQQTVLNAAAAAIAGFVIAALVRKEGQVAALLGLLNALLALAVGFGADLSAEDQALIMSAAGALAAAFIRTQVVATVTADGDRQV